MFNGVSKKGRQKEIIYSILLDCSELVSDEYWKQFYKDLATGKSTKGIYITNGIIQTSNKRNGFIYSITDKTPETIVKELHHLLITHTNICSKKDISKKLQIIKQIEDEINYYKSCKWSSIKRKNYRNMLLVEYCLYLKRKYNLSWTNTINAYKIIIFAFDSKTHSSNDVVYNNGKVTNIYDIIYSNESMINTRQIIEDIKDTDTCISIQKLFEPYITAWIKYIND